MNEQVKRPQSDPNPVQSNGSGTDYASQSSGRTVEGPGRKTLQANALLLRFQRRSRHRTQEMRHGSEKVPTADFLFKCGSGPMRKFGHIYNTDNRSHKVQTSRASTSETRRYARHSSLKNSTVLTPTFPFPESFLRIVAAFPGELKPCRDPEACYLPSLKKKSRLHQSWMEA